MIRVAPKPEPLGFDQQVRQPGLRALADGRRELPTYWARCLDQLWDAYGGVCAYLCIIIVPGTGFRTVEHCAPKSKRRDLAYEWSNYRLVCGVMNARKSGFEDVLDPFEVQDGWFTLELSTLEVLPHPDLKRELRQEVENTIARLKLNDSQCLAARRMYYDEYLQADRGLTFELLQRWSPFVAKELIRQGIVRPRATPKRASRAKKSLSKKARNS